MDSIQTLLASVEFLVMDVLWTVLDRLRRILGPVRVGYTDLAKQEYGSFAAANNFPVIAA